VTHAEHVAPSLASAAIAATLASFHNAVSLRHVKKRRDRMRATEVIDVTLALAALELAIQTNALTHETDINASSVLLTLRAKSTAKLSSCLSHLEKSNWRKKVS